MVINRTVLTLGVPGHLPYTVYSTSHPPGSVFQAPLLDNQEVAKADRCGLRKDLGEILPTPNVLAPTLFRLWRYLPWKIGPGVCDVHRRIYTVVTSPVPFIFNLNTSIDISPFWRGMISVHPRFVVFSHRPHFPLPC